MKNEILPLTVLLSNVAITVSKVVMTNKEIGHAANTY